MERLVGWPWLGEERLLEACSGGNGISGSAEDGEAAVSLAARADNVTSMLCHDLLYQGVMPHEGLSHGIAMLLPEGGAGVNVGEEKGDRAGWELSHGRVPHNAQVGHRQYKGSANRLERSSVLPGML